MSVIVKVFVDDCCGGHRAYIADGGDSADVAEFESAPDAIEYMERNGIDISKAEIIESIGRCRFCGGNLYPSDVHSVAPDERYYCQCFKCDEDFFRFEQFNYKEESL